MPAVSYDTQVQMALRQSHLSANVIHELIRLYIVSSLAFVKLANTMPLHVRKIHACAYAIGLDLGMHASV